MIGKIGIGDPVYIVWYNEDVDSWEIDDGNIYAGELPLLHLYGIIPKSARKSQRNLYYVEAGEIFADRSAAENNIASKNRIRNA